MHNQMLVPPSTTGKKDTIPFFPGYEWIAKLPNKKIYFALFQNWWSEDLPPDYDYYVVSFHLEAVNLPWLKRQKVLGPIIVLSDGYHYNLNLPGVHFLTFFYWHYQLQKMQEWFGVKEKSIIPKYKFSAVCNRVSQIKVWTTTKLLETARESSLIVLNSWVKTNDIHNWENTGNDVLDNLTQIFCNRYNGQQIKIDDFDSKTQNKQNVNGNPWQPLYQDCAIHFTNESFHYSHMTEEEKSYIWPGPFLTEKTLKCLLGGTAFISVGQFETYKTLTTLGFNFDYDFDTAWDLDSGNLSRAESIINLIDYLNQFTIDQLISKTQENSRYNQNHILSSRFYEQCQQKNEESVAQIVKLIS
jgi:hypothetical protein